MHKVKTKKALDLWTLDHLALRLGISIEELNNVAENTSKLYRSWQMPKKDGSFRPITDAVPRLKKIQKAIHRLLTEIDPGNSAHGGVHGKTNRTNAAVHCGADFIYKLDFSSYFPSISHHRVFHLFRHDLKCSYEVASLLTKLCILDGCVPQGSSTSMDIANLVCRDLDLWLEAVSKSYGIKYTRYVDDLTFSGKYIPKRFLEKVKNIIKSKRWLSLNNKKESLNGRNQTQTVTGLNVKYQTPRISRSFKRSVKIRKHFLMKSLADGIIHDELEKEISVIKGKENYISYIEKE